MHVELDAVCPLLQGQGKRGKCVFSPVAGSPAVGDDLRHESCHDRDINGRLNVPQARASNLEQCMIEAEREDEASLDRALIERWREGDESAATAIVERHAPALARFAVRLGVTDDIDELVQDTFVRAFAALDGFRADSALRTWLFTIERHLVLDRRRSAKRRGVEVEVHDDLPSSGYDALDGMVADELSQRMVRAIARLSRMQREVFTLRVQEGRSYKEIAVILDSSEGAARVHYHNAIRAVKEFLDD
ncbi:MAG TPA: RNA polymerase sigma factor [Gemmatimonas sp.]|nr:RNA polymerase sigma factor [Gemmatimonas sp.]